MPSVFIRNYNKPKIMIQPTRSNKSSGLMRKLNKLKTKPKHFIVDSSGFKLAHRSWKKSLKLGSFYG
jgi:capsular polysaccharide transport system permease protein